MKQSLLNRCNDCGHTWFPRGFDVSKKCPSCAGGDVDKTGFMYLALLAVMALGAGIFWATDRPRKNAHAAAAPAATPMLHMKSHAGVGPPEIPLGPITINNEADGRREALRLYPDLGIANSPLNREFVIRYNSYQRLEPEIFQNPAWPVILAKESAAAIGEPLKTQ